MEGDEGGNQNADVVEEEEVEARLWSWGAGSDGQLATGTLEDQWLPQPLHSFPSVHPIIHMACGGAHAIALTRDGRVLTWGRGTSGQLGHGDLENRIQPKLVKFFEDCTVNYISAGWNHSGFVTGSGHLFMCGDGSFGQLGNGYNSSHSLPQEVLFFRSMHVEQVACGMRHSLALARGSSGYSVYGYGSGRHGQIGRLIRGGRKFINIPETIDGFEGSTMVFLCANGDHSAALSANGKLYTWGRGFGESFDCPQPRLISSSLKFSHIALGWNHALVISDGEVYMLGRMLSSFTQSEELPDNAVSAPSSITNEALAASPFQRIACPVGEKVISIAAGAEHSALLTDEGSILTWGWGEHGQLGLGNTADQIFPHKVGIVCKRSASCGQLGVFCGSGFTFAAKLG